VAQGHRGRATLTERQRQVLSLMAEGITYQIIAERLGISTHTVTTHVDRAFLKLGVRSREEAVQVAIKEALIP